jgi:hypothetical protein
LYVLCAYGTVPASAMCGMWWKLPRALLHLSQLPIEKTCREREGEGEEDEHMRGEEEEWRRGGRGRNIVYQHTVVLYRTIYHVLLEDVYLTK